MPNDSLINNFESTNGNESCDSYIHPPTNKLVPELEIPFKRYVIKQSVKPRKKEGLNSLYKASAIFWLLLCHRSPSLRVGKTYHLINEAMRRYRYKLYDLSIDPECLDYRSLIDRGYMKEKHWIYAAYMAGITSLPLLYKLCSAQEILNAIFAKTAFGADIKLLDNLNDEFHDKSQGVESLLTWLSAHNKGEYINRNRAQDPIITRAENSAFEMETWVFNVVSSCRLYESDDVYRDYINDAIKWVKGQADSLRHKEDRKGELPSIRDYIGRISEKSIGDLWIDIDLCFLENRLKDPEGQSNAIELLKKGYSIVFKSSLVYDDVQDIYEDLTTNSINSAVILAVEGGLISERDLKERSPDGIIETMKEEGILMKTIRLADMVFLKGIEMVNSIDSSLDGIIDKKGLIQGFRFLRLFNLRKLLIRKKNYETMKLFFSSLADFEKMKKDIPDDIMALQRYLV